MSSFISEKIPPIPSLILHSLYSVLPVLQLAALLEHLGKGGSWIPYFKMSCIWQHTHTQNILKLLSLGSQHCVSTLQPKTKYLVLQVTSFRCLETFSWILGKKTITVKCHEYLRVVWQPWSRMTMLHSEEDLSNRRVSKRKDYITCQILLFPREWV